MTFQLPAPRTLIHDGFESSKPGSPLDGLVTASGNRWTVRQDQADDIVVDSDISYGREHQS